MQYRLFQFPLPTDPELAELNAFLSSHRIATVRQEIVSTAGGSMLVFVVEMASSTSSIPKNGSKTRIDYRDVLSDSDFRVFSELREMRKELAAQDGVPVYAVFSNAQLAEIVQKKVKCRADFSKVDGIGQARVEKYADPLLPILRAAFPLEGIKIGEETRREADQ